MHHCSARHRSLPALLRLAVLLLAGFLVPAGSAAPADDSARARFAVIGDYGEANVSAAAVAALAGSWDPEFIITAGDNSYSGDLDSDIGQNYHEYIFPYRGTRGPGARANRFFPALGNHDWDNRVIGCDGDRCTGTYLDYFALPGNERYYDLIRGPVQLFALDSDDREPDGIASSSAQASWLRARLRASHARWKIVYFHHPPFASGAHDPRLRWPFADWGATAVITGHLHVYERILKSGFPYFVNGLGGRSRQPFGEIEADSQVRYNADFGAMLVEADETRISFRFFSIAGSRSLIDTFVIDVSALEPATWGSIKAFYR